MSFLIMLILLLTCNVFAETNDICDILRIPNCAGVTRQLRRTSAGSIPSATTASSMNPANVTFDRGVGLDIMAQGHNPLLFGLSSGTGKMGGALINGSIENGFFGNRVPELESDIQMREELNLQYRNKKLAVALAGRIVNKKKIGIDLGLILKRHPKIKTINPGLGISGRVWKINFGYSIYKDDFFIDAVGKTNPGSGLPYPEESYKETFQVTTLTLGTRIGDLALDYGSIKSSLDFYGKPTNITIYSTSYHYNKFLINLAWRKEHSQAPIFKDGEIQMEENKSAIYMGLQYSINQHIIIGISYNYFLLRDIALSTTLFI